MSYTYVDVVNANLICCICRECITRTVDTSHACPIDRSPLALLDLRPQTLLIRNMVDELIVECPYRATGCMHVCQRQLLGLHLRESCQYEQVACPEEGCDKQVLRKDLGRHSHDCIHRVVTCDACGSPIRALDKDPHRSDCPAQQVVCEFCYETLFRSELAEHNAVCPHFVLPCVHSKHGCPWTGSRDTLQSLHLITCPYESLKGFFVLNDARIALLADENAVLKQRLHAIEVLIDSFRRDVETARKALGPWWRSGATAEPSLYPDLPQAEHAVAPTGSDHIAGRADVSRTSNSRQIIQNMATSALDHNDLYSISRPAFNDPDFLAPYFPPVHEPVNTSSTVSPPLHSTSPTDRLASTSHLAAQSLYITQTQRYADIPPVMSPTNGAGPGRPLPQSTVAPVDLSTTVEGALSGLRNSIVTLSASLDSVVRRQDIALKTENMRMGEDMYALRAVVHGLRMQVHGIMMERNNQVTGRGGEGTAEWNPPIPFNTYPPIAGYHLASMQNTTSTTKL